MTTPALLSFFIPAIAAQRAEVEQLAPAPRPQPTLSVMPAAQDPNARVSYRFTYRYSRGGPVYGCRIKASRGMADLLMERLFDLAESAETEGDTALLAGCALAIEAIEGAKLQTSATLCYQRASTR
jgi:hypothetical protein